MTAPVTPNPLRWHWQLLCGDSAAAGRHNEDAWGASPAGLWVLDGATGVSRRRCTRGPSDAAWLAYWVAGWLDHASRRSDGPPLEPLLGELEAALGLGFQAELARHGGDGVEDIDMPSACLGLARVEGDLLALACVGDIAILVRQPDGRHTLYTDTASAPAGARTLQAWLDARWRGVPDDQLWEQVRPVILRNRETVNRPGGYRVVHPTRPWAAGVTVHRLPLVPGLQVLLASDGLWRLVELFGELDGPTLMERLSNGGWPQTLDLLRRLEREDVRAQRFPRVKTSDDATAVLATLAGPSSPGAAS